MVSGLKPSPLLVYTLQLLLQRSKAGGGQSLRLVMDPRGFLEMVSRLMGEPPRSVYEKSPFYASRRRTKL